MKVTASDFYTYYRPSECALRIQLRHRGLEEAEPGPYEEVIRRLGTRYEQDHLATFPSYVDISIGTLEERERMTRSEVAKAASVIYQPVLRVVREIDAVDCEIIGEPDFLINFNGKYLIRDVKLSRRITLKDHPEIILQLGLYGWLFEQVFGSRPESLEVYSGTGQIVRIDYDEGTAALEVLQKIIDYKRASEELYSPVGWTKCGSCGFRDRCWKNAEGKKDVARVVGVDQGLVVALREIGIITVQDFLREFTEERLQKFKRPWGKGTQRVGNRATSIMHMARALASDEERLLQKPDVPHCPNYVMFDLEGLPPQLDELEKIYLWGLQVFGEKPGRFQPALAGFGDNGDREGWKSFLTEADKIFAEYGDIPFVHWHHYEKTHLKMYLERFGDRNNIAERAIRNLLDLLPITQQSVTLPLPSYSLKVVEKYIGFKRTQEEYGGDWAMAKYIEATEIGDEELRAKVVDQILTYNQEDLQAIWAVLKWLRSKTA